MFNNTRLSLARKRRGLNARELAQMAGLTPVHLSRMEKEPSEPNSDTISRLAEALNVPIDFFFANDAEDLDAQAVSFRSLSKMTAKERDAAISAGQLGIELNKWVEQRFSLPWTDLPDMNEESPEAAACLLRQQWGIGEQPIGNLIGLLEMKGVRFFYLPENIEAVDAFSFWRRGRPYIFMNRHKTAERNIFDIAHELGHLILHQESYGDKRTMEGEANAFASAIMMPENDIRARMPRLITINVIIKAKLRWRVSALALTYRLHRLRLLSEWQYKSLCIELGKRGYRSGEPNGIQKEKPVIWEKVLKHLWNEKITKSQIAQENFISLDELEGLIGAAAEIPSPEKFLGKSCLSVV